MSSPLDKTFSPSRGSSTYLHLGSKKLTSGNRPSRRDPDSSRRTPVRPRAPSGYLTQWILFEGLAENRLGDRGQKNADAGIAQRGAAGCAIDEFFRIPQMDAG